MLLENNPFNELSYWIKGLSLKTRTLEVDNCAPESAANLEHLCCPWDVDDSIIHYWLCWYWHSYQPLKSNKRWKCRISAWTHIPPHGSYSCMLLIWLLGAAVFPHLCLYSTSHLLPPLPLPASWVYSPSPSPPSFVVPLWCFHLCLPLGGFFVIVIFLPFARHTCSNALVLLISACQSSRPADKNPSVQLVVFQLMAHMSGHTHTHTHTHTRTATHNTYLS